MSAAVPTGPYTHQHELDYEEHIVAAANWAERAEQYAAKDQFDQVAVNFALMHAAVAQAIAAAPPPEAPVDSMQSIHDDV